MKRIEKNGRNEKIERIGTTKIYVGLGFLGAFLLWTALLRLIDVAPVGPLGSEVGFSALNQWVHGLTGVHLVLYTVTDWLGLVPLGVAFGFAVFGLLQWIRRKHLLKVDRSILVLGGFYVVVMAVYLLFEAVTVNYRPILINGVLETSYPSSTTMLCLCVMPTAMLQWKRRIRRTALKRWTLWGTAAFTAFMVVARLISGVHWFTDIVGGGLVSVGLVLLYDGIA